MPRYSVLAKAPCPQAGPTPAESNPPRRLTTGQARARRKPMPPLPPATKGGRRPRVSRGLVREATLTPFFPFPSHQETDAVFHYTGRWGPGPRCEYGSPFSKNQIGDSVRGSNQATPCRDSRASTVRAHAELRGAPASACPSAATASATISSNPDGSVASAAASSMQLSLARPRSKRGERRCTRRAGARRSRASITATSTSSRCTRCTPTRRCQRWRLLRSRGMDERHCVCACARASASAGGGAIYIYRYTYISIHARTNVSIQIHIYGYKKIHIYIFI